MTNNRNQGPAEIWVCPSGTSILPVSNANPFPVAIVSGGGSGGTASSFGASFPLVGTAVGFIDPSGNMAGAKVDADGNVLVAGTFSASTSATASSSAPSYSPGSQPLSQDLSGNLRTIFANSSLAVTQSGIWTVGIDQTIPGTTNLVDVSNFPAAVDVNTGNASNNTPRVVLASNQPAVPVSQSGTWNITNISGTISLPTGAATAANQTAVQAATGAAVPASAIYQGINVAGNIRGRTGVNPSGSIYAASTDLSSVAGTTLSTGSGAVGTGTPRIAVGTDTATIAGSAPTTALTANAGAITPVLKNGLTNSASSVVSSQAATLESYYIYNPNSSVAYIQIYDAATAGGVTVGSTTPKWSIGIPATSAANLANLGLIFASGIQVAATTTATGGSAPATALDCNFGYK